jgi:uncharacterized membrane protein YedE/YeeE
MKLLFALLAGVVFGIGLILSGMTDPAKVIGFLDLAGLWNPAQGGDWRASVRDPRQRRWPRAPASRCCSRRPCWPAWRCSN